ncbi:MAG: hypothetical protein EPN47_16370 [Acidobacteria bacterium]|nr:MAG: hypothetical protein EPN47_16370 [Acidobacteriota bacterium]
MDSFNEEHPFLLTALILIGGYIFLYFNLFSLPATPFHFLSGDATTYLFNARRMLRGEVIYRDFFQFTTPATEVFFLLLFKIAGVRAWIPNVVLIGLGLGIAWLMIVISKQVIPGRAAYLPAVLFLVVPFRGQLNPTHHWFSMLFVMAALTLLVEHASALRLVGAGTLCGVAMCFTQSTGLTAEVGLALFLLWAAWTGQMSWENFRTAQSYIWVPFGTVVVLFNAYFMIRAGFTNFVHDTVVFGLRYWPSGQSNTIRAFMTDMPASHPWYRSTALAIWASIYLLVPLIYILFFVRYRDEKEDRPAEAWDRLVLIAIMGAMLFLGVAASPTWPRLCTVAAPGVILFVWFLNSPGRLRVIRTTAIWAVAGVLALGECGGRLMAWRQTVRLPIGQVAVINPIQYEEVNFLLARTKPGDYFFGSNELNYLLDLRDPSPLPYVTASDYTRPQQVQQTIQGLEKHPVKYVYWPSILDMPPEDGHGPNHLRPLRAYLESHYQIVQTVEGDDFARSFWEKVSLSAPIPLPSLEPQPTQGQPGGAPAGTSSPARPLAAPLDAPARVP